MNALVQTRPLRRQIAFGQDTLHTLLRVAGWAFTTSMATLGVVTLFFFVLGSFTVPGTMLQLDNLTSRYLAADTARQDQFHAILLTVIAGSFVLIGILRRGSLRIALKMSGNDHG